MSSYLWVNQPHVRQQEHTWIRQVSNNVISLPLSHYKIKHCEKQICRHTSFSFNICSPKYWVWFFQIKLRNVGFVFPCFSNSRNINQIFLMSFIIINSQLNSYSQRTVISVNDENINNSFKYGILSKSMFPLLTHWNNIYIYNNKYIPSNMTNVFSLNSEFFWTRISFC